MIELAQDVWTKLAAKKKKSLSHLGLVYHLLNNSVNLLNNSVTETLSEPPTELITT